MAIHGYMGSYWLVLLGSHKKFWNLMSGDLVSAFKFAFQFLRVKIPYFITFYYSHGGNNTTPWTRYFSFVLVTPLLKFLFWIIILWWSWKFKLHTYILRGIQDVLFHIKNLSQYLLFGTVEKVIKLLAHLATQRLSKMTRRAVSLDHVIICKCKYQEETKWKFQIKILAIKIN
jgi:hypothetical protein